MLTCLPESLCSWNFRVVDPSRQISFVRFDFFTEQGVIQHEGAQYRIIKHGWLSGQWSLIASDVTFARAVKPNALFRSFDISTQEYSLVTRAQTFVTRAYDIFTPSRRVGVIMPSHAFTRRSTIECSAEIPVLSQLFCFWLAVTTWRRAARNSASTASS